MCKVIARRSSTKLSMTASLMTLEEEKTTPGKTDLAELAASDPGVREFATLVGNAVKLQRGLKVWLERFDDMETRANETIRILDLCSRSDHGGKQYLTQILKALWSIEWALDRGCESITFVIARKTFPQCFPKE